MIRNRDNTLTKLLRPVEKSGQLVTLYAESLTEPRNDEKTKTRNLRILEKLKTEVLNNSSQTVNSNAVIIHVENNEETSNSSSVVFFSPAMYENCCPCNSYDNGTDFLFDSSIFAKAESCKIIKPESFCAVPLFQKFGKTWKTEQLDDIWIIEVFAVFERYDVDVLNATLELHNNKNNALITFNDRIIEDNRGIIRIKTTVKGYELDNLVIMRKANSAASAEHGLTKIILYIDTFSVSPTTINCNEFLTQLVISEQKPIDEQNQQTNSSTSNEYEKSDEIPMFELPPPLFNLLED